jgi:hypothetical protein
MRRFIIEALAQPVQAKPDGSLSMGVSASRQPMTPMVVTGYKGTVYYTSAGGFTDIVAQPLGSIDATPRFRLTCLNCGLITEALYHAMQRHLIDHACEDREEPHWHKVVRDAVIDGKDSDVIRLITSELGLTQGE